jgi:hypothetical protein
MTTTWDSLLTAALLGTERRAPQIPPDAPAPLTQLATNDNERLLLSASGMMSVYRRAGFTPPTDSRSLGTPAPEETLKPCSVRCVSRLLQLLVHPEQNKLLIGEWMLIMAGKHKRIPHYFLPDVMDGMRRDTTTMTLLLPLLGERGRWLAAQNEEWAKYLKLTGEPTWIHALFTRTVPAEEVAKTEAEALESINTKPANDYYAFNPLGKCRHIWSDTLMEAFLTRMFATHEKKLRVSFDADTVGLFAASVPRGSGIGMMMQRLKNAAGDETKQYIFFKPLMEMLDLRRDMLQELSHE